MSELTGIYALWYREWKVFTRETSRVISSVINPVLWLVIIGGGLGSVISFGGINYQTFLYPGILVQAAIFSSVFFGVYMVWDRKIDFFKEVLVAPISRTSMFFGKVLGGATDTLIQIVILFIIGAIFLYAGIMPQLQLNAVSIVLSFLILLVTTIALVSVGLIIGSQMESPEGFQLVISFLVFPMFFLSGALFPINNLPSWLAPFVFLDPVTYTVDGLRGVLVGASTMPYLLDFGVVVLFAIVFILLGAFAFSKMKV